jgi:hypothetical protein
VTEREREARRLRLFLARLAQDQAGAAAVLDRLRMAVERVRASVADPVTVGAAALYLQNFYTAVEESLKRVALELDGGIPASDDWHRELLGQMALAIEAVRPRVIDDALHADLDLLRRFRHLVRHAYAADFDWDEMQPALAAAERVMRDLPAALGRVEETVRAVIRECESG